MRDARLRWLLGIDERRLRLGAWVLFWAALLPAGAALVLGGGLNDGHVVTLMSVPALAALAYAAWNGGPLTAVGGSLGATAVLAAGWWRGVPVGEPEFALIALPAALAAFGVAAYRSHRAMGGPSPLGAGRLGPALLVLWVVAVLGLAALAALWDETRLGPRIFGAPAWVPWLRALTTWSPAGIALGYAATRRGPALSFALATTNLWAWYLARWHSMPLRTTNLYLGELLVPAQVDVLRGCAILALGLLAMGLAMMFEPAWPWISYRQEPAPARGGHQV